MLWATSDYRQVQACAASAGLISPVDEHRHDRRTAPYATEHFVRCSTFSTRRLFSAAT